MPHAATDLQYPVNRIPYFLLTLPPVVRQHSVSVLPVQKPRQNIHLAILFGFTDTIFRASNCEALRNPSVLLSGLSGRLTPYLAIWLSCAICAVRRLEVARPPTRASCAFIRLLFSPRSASLATRGKYLVRQSSYCWRVSAADVCQSPEGGLLRYNRISQVFRIYRTP